MRGEENPGSPAMQLKDLDQAWMVFVAGSIAFVIYDVGFSKLIAFYEVRVERSTGSEYSSKH